MYILVNHTKDCGIMEVGRFDMWQDATREIAKGMSSDYLKKKLGEARRL